MNEEILKALRNMAWERAKGELSAMATTYYEKYDGDKFRQFWTKVGTFIYQVEQDGLHE